MILYLICLNNNIRGGDAIMKNRKSAIFFCVFQNLTREPFFFFCTSLKVLRCDIFLKIKGLELELLIELLYGPCT